MHRFIAVPSKSPGGLDASLEAHFGHCEVYTLVHVENGEVTKIEVVSNPPHQAGGCLAPVHELARNGVNTLIVGGMGQRPLAGCSHMGIDVYFSDGAGTVGQAIDAILASRLRRFSHENACSDGCGNHRIDPAPFSNR